MASSSTRKGKGRQKIKMEKIEKESNLQVTFSKRRNGVFKKAHELSILTGAEVAAIVFSPGGKVFSFGHPTTEAVAERFLSGTSQPLTLIQQLVQAQRNANVVETNAELARVKNMIEFEKKKGEALDRALFEGQGRHWGGADLDEQNLSHLQQSATTLRNAKAEFEREINARAIMQQNYRAPAGGYIYYGGDGGFPPLMGPTYVGNGSGSSPLAVTRPIGYVGSEGTDGDGGSSFFPLVMGPGEYGDGGGSGIMLPGGYGAGGGGSGSGVILPDGYGGGGVSGVLPGSGGAWFYGNAGDIGGGCSDGRPYLAGHSSFTGGVGSGVLPNIYGASLAGVGNDASGWSFGDGTIPFGGGGLFVDGGGSGDGLTSFDGASSFGAGNGGVGSSRVLNWNGTMPPHGFGGGF